MAISKASFHVRSISLPSASHPQDASVEDHLRRLRTSQAGPSSSSSICQSLRSVKDLYEQMDSLIHLPQHQKGLCKRDVEDVLEGSLALLDASSSALDGLSQMKECVLAFESSLRRGSEDEGINTYLSSRKKIIKTVSKCLVNMKKAEKSCDLKYPDSDTNTVKMLKEAEMMSLSALKSVLTYVKGKKGPSQQTSGWSMIAKLVKSNASCDAENATEVNQVDRTLSALLGKQSGSETKTTLINQLKTLEMVIHELEETMESVSRCFVKTRVSVLNVLNH